MVSLWAMCELNKNVRLKMQSRRVGRRLELPHGPPESVALRSPWPLGQTNVKFGHDAGPRLSQRTDGGGAIIGFGGRGLPFLLSTQLAIPQAR